LAAAIRGLLSIFSLPEDKVSFACVASWLVGGSDFRWVPLVCRPPGQRTGVRVLFLKRSVPHAYPLLNLVWGRCRGPFLLTPGSFFLSFYAFEGPVPRALKSSLGETWGGGPQGGFDFSCGGGWTYVGVSSEGAMREAVSFAELGPQVCVVYGVVCLLCGPKRCDAGVV